MSHAQESNALDSRGYAQFTVKSGERKAAPLRQLQIGCVIQREPVACSQPRRRTPRLSVGVGVKADWQESKVG